MSIFLPLLQYEETSCCDIYFSSKDIKIRISCISVYRNMKSIFLELFDIDTSLNIIKEFLHYLYHFVYEWPARTQASDKKLPDLFYPI